MRITVGNTVLGDYPGVDEDIPIAGFSAGVDADIVTGRGTLTTAQRVRLKGNVRTSLTIPTVRTFDTVSEAQKWIVDLSLSGPVDGRMVVTYQDGSDSVADWAVATPGEMNHYGVSVRVTWAIQAGKKLV